MNISGIRENNFWVILGGAIAFMVALYLFYGNPYRGKYSERLGQIKEAVAELEVYERKGGKIINEKWIKMAEMELEAIEKEQLEYKELLRERDYHIEKFFDAENGEGVKDEALWKSSYEQRANLLLDNLARSNIYAGRGALPFKEWGNEIPTRDKIAEEQKKFWITEELLNIIQKRELKVYSIESIDFGKEGFSHDDSNRDVYDIIPFTIKLSMDTEEIPFLIDELLKSKILFEVDTFMITGRLNKLRSSKLLETSEIIHQDTRVNVIINAYAIDFKA